MNLEIIVIDDDEVVLFLHELYLKENFTRHYLKTFNSAEKAIDYLNEKTHTTTEYLVLIDINMPRMTGWDFIDAIQYQPFQNKLHIVIATSSIDERDKKRAGSYSQVIDYCEKPINDELCTKLKGLPAISQLLYSDGDVSKTQ